MAQEKQSPVKQTKAAADRGTDEVLGQMFAYFNYDEAPVQRRPVTELEARHAA